MLTLRILLALLVLFPLNRLRGHTAPDRQSKAELLVVGAVGLGISLGTQFVGTDLSTALNGALVTSASPAFVVLFAMILLREGLTRARFASIVLSSIGVLVILNPAAADFSSASFIGNVFLAIAALTWGLYSVLVRTVALRHALPTLTVTVYALIGGLLLSIPASALELTQRPLGELDAICRPGRALPRIGLNGACPFALESRLCAGSRDAGFAILLRPAAIRRAIVGVASRAGNDLGALARRRIDRGGSAAVDRSRATERARC